MIKACAIWSFIKKEKIYVFMLIYILTLSLMSMRHGSEKKNYDGQEALSAKTLSEIGITEEKVRGFFESEKFSARFFKHSIFFGVFIFLLAIVSNLVFIFRRKKIDLESRHLKFSIGWGILDIVRAIIIILFAGYTISVAAGMTFKIFNIMMPINFQMMINTFFTDLVAALVIVYFVVIKYKSTLKDLGLGFKSFVSNVISGITAYIFILPFLLMILLGSIWILNMFGYTPPPQPVFEMFMEEKRSRVLLFLTIFVSVLGPVVEEMFFRGFMYAAIRKHLGIIGAAFLSASIFSILHTNIVGFFPIMTLGVLLAYLYEKTGSLVSSMTVHILHNSIIIGGVFLIKELVA